MWEGAKRLGHWDSKAWLRLLKLLFSFFPASSRPGYHPPSLEHVSFSSNRWLMKYSTARQTTLRFEFSAGPWTPRCAVFTASLLQPVRHEWKRLRRTGSACGLSVAAVPCSLASGQNRTLRTSPCGVICKHSRCAPTRYIMQAVFYETPGFLNLPRLRIHSHHY